MADDEDLLLLGGYVGVEGSMAAYALLGGRQPGLTVRDVVEVLDLR